MRVYNRAMGGTSWNTLEEYVETPTVRWYGTSAACGQDYDWLAGHWLSGCAPPPEGTMLYLDAFGIRVGGNWGTAAVPTRVPEFLDSNSEYPVGFGIGNDLSYTPMIAAIPIACAIVCAGATVCLGACLRVCGWNAACLFRCMWNSVLCRIVGLACLACVIYYGWRLLVRWCPNIRTYIIQCGERYANPIQFIACVIRLCLGIPPLPKEVSTPTTAVL